MTVTLEDFKTLQVGTLLNDVIVDFYMKYLQFTQFSDQDKNRWVLISHQHNHVHDQHAHVHHHHDQLLIPFFSSGFTSSPHFGFPA